MALFGTQQRKEMAKLEQEISRLQPEERAILSDILVDTIPAEREMKRRIQLGRLAGREFEKEVALPARGEQFKEKLAFRRESLETRKGITTEETEARHARARAGIQSGEEIDMGRLAQRDRVREYERGQLPLAYGIGVAGIGASGLMGYSQMQRDIKAAERWDKDRKKWNLISGSK